MGVCCYVVCKLLIGVRLYLLCRLRCPTFADVGNVLDNAGLLLLKIVRYSSTNVPGSTYLIRDGGKGA